MPGWPFWAATTDERIELAFDLVRLEAGERLLDIGCGDGRVLLRAAAFRGARVTGIELDPALAATARALLAEHDIEATILEADFTAAPIDDLAPDVVFAYLSPATLQRLRPRLAELPTTTRIVTTGYAIPGWQPQVAGGRCYVYRLPPEPDDVDDAAPPGWVSDGVLVTIHPDAPSLIAVKLRARADGPVVVTADGELDRIVTVRTGADEAHAGDDVIVDLRFDPSPAGTVVMGDLVAPGEPPFHVYLVVDEGTPGMWGLSASLCQRVAEAVAASPDDLGAVLEEARQAEPG